MDVAKSPTCIGDEVGITADKKETLPAWQNSQELFFIWGNSIVV